MICGQGERCGRKVYGPVAATAALIWDLGGEASFLYNVFNLE